MSYKHGDWYCKPANEEEAREIVERAVASGAKRHDIVVGQYKIKNEYEYKWNYCDAWGVANSETNTQSERYFRGNAFVEYTIAQVREKFQLPGEQQTEWNGEGLPPVGIECEMLFDGEWISAKLIGFDEESPIVKMQIKRDRCTEIVYRPCYCCKYRPIRTERERWVEQALNILQKDPCAMPSQLMGMVYDAIKAGTLKAPEVE